MLDLLFGSKVKEQTLQYILSRGKAYSQEIADFWDNKSRTAVQKQLDALEKDGILVSFKYGKMRLYEFKPSYPLLPELIAMLEKARTFYKPEIKEALIMNRKRPRRKGKPIIMQPNITALKSLAADNE